MAGAAIDRQLSAGVSRRVRFIRADARHDEAIRRLLRDNPMTGEVTLTLEREPDYFCGSRLPGVIEDRTIVALEEDRVVCMGSCSVRERFVNGEPRRTGYLGGLRLDRSVRGRWDIIRGGYEFFASSMPEPGPECFFTSIAADNFRSLRLLERGLPGLPRYRFLSEYVTMLVPVPGSPSDAERAARKTERNLRRLGLQCSRGSRQQATALAGLFNDCGRRSQFAAHWTEEQLLGLADFGLPASGYQVVSNGETIVGSAGVWDQRSFKQTVIRGYSQRLSLLRPWINFAGHLFGTARLPAPGSTLEHAFLSPCATRQEHPELLPDLVRLSLPLAASRGIRFLTLGLGSGDPRIGLLRAAFHCREYPSRMYQVAWDSAPCRVEVTKGGVLSPEVAYL